MMLGQGNSGVCYAHCACHGSFHSTGGTPRRSRRAGDLRWHLGLVELAPEHSAPGCCGSLLQTWDPPAFRSEFDGIAPFLNYHDAKGIDLVLAFEYPGYTSFPVIRHRRSSQNTPSTHFVRCISPS